MELTARLPRLLPTHSSILSMLMYVIMVTVGTSLIFVAAALSFNETTVFRNIGIRSIATLANVIGSNSTAALAFSDKNVGSEILNGLRSEPEIILGCLYSREGQIFATYLSSNNKETCPAKPPLAGPQFTAGKLYFGNTINHEGESYGSLLLVSDMQSYYRQLRVYAFLLMAVLIGASIIAYLIASRLQDLVTGPVLKLARTAQYISEKGQYSLRAERTQEVELNTLVTSFNQMLDAIQEREEKLKRSEQQFRTAFEMAAVGNVMISPDGHFIRVNSEICRILGYSKEELLKLQFLDITHPEDREESTKAYEKLIHNEVSSLVLEKRYLAKSGAVVWVNISAAPVSSNQGQIYFIISAIQDVTFRKRAEEDREQLLMQERKARLEAEKSIQVRDDFLSIASHELRTPITPIKMQLQLVKLQLQKTSSGQLPERETLLKSFDISERQVANLEQLIQDLLDVSRITAGRMILNLKPVDMVKLVEDVLERMHPEILKSGSPVITVFQAHPIGLWDPMRIEQIFVNLLSNALKYGNSKPIEVRVFQKGEQAGLVVKDRGIGISQINQSKIFERFERVASIKHYAGLGLGLYITKELVSAHHGTIQVESALGEGAQFQVQLPLDFSSL